MLSQCLARSWPISARRVISRAGDPVPGGLGLGAVAGVVLLATGCVPGGAHPVALVLVSEG